MRRHLIALLAGIAISSLLVAGCGSMRDAASRPSGPTRYTDTEMDLLASVEGAPKTVTVRFYERTPNVPYIGLAHYLSLVFGEDAKVEVEDGVATITSADGGVAVIDDALDTFTTDDWAAFHNYLEPMRQGKMQGFVDFATPFCRVRALDYEEQTAPLTFDFSSYGIDLVVGDDDAYLPLATASDLMADIALNNLACNGERLCLLCGFDEEPSKLDPTWYVPLATDEPRSQDMADFTYAELCFAFDAIYSCSGKGILDEAIATDGLDAALATTDELTRRIRDLLRSLDKAEYLAGLTMLNQYVMNYHTNLDDQALGSVLDPAIAERRNALIAEFSPAFATKDYNAKIQDNRDIILRQAASTRSKIWSDGASYHEQDDTAVIAIDSFLSYDREGWDAYYAGTGARPGYASDTDDPIGCLLAGLERAKANTDIRNVVLDLSANVGGSNDLCATAAALITGRTKAPVFDLATGQRYDIDYEIDSRFDKSFDATAASASYDFNYAVLTSRATFSCGNYFASLLADAGIPVIGEPSGGGTDMVMRLVTPCGQSLMMSDGFAQMTDAAGVQIEEGIPVDVDLVTLRADGSKDYSSLYDIGHLSEVMATLYPPEESLSEAA